MEMSMSLQRKTPQNTHWPVIKTELQTKLHNLIPMENREKYRCWNCIKHTFGGKTATYRELGHEEKNSIGSKRQTVDSRNCRLPRFHKRIINATKFSPRPLEDAPITWGNKKILLLSWVKLLWHDFHVIGERRKEKVLTKRPNPEQVASSTMPVVEGLQPWLPKLGAKCNREIPHARKHSSHTHNNL